MAMTVVGLFERLADAQQAQAALEQAGFAAGDTDMKAPHTGEDAHSDLSGLQEQLTDGGVLPEDARRFADGVSAGHTLLMVQAETNQVDAALETMNRFGAIRIKDWSPNASGIPSEEDADDDLSVRTI